MGGVLHRTPPSLTFDTSLILSLRCFLDVRLSRPRVPAAATRTCILMTETVVQVYHLHSYRPAYQVASRGIETPSNGVPTTGTATAAAASAERARTTTRARVTTTSSTRRRSVISTRMVALAVTASVSQRLLSTASWCGPAASHYIRPRLPDRMPGRCLCAHRAVGCSLHLRLLTPRAFATVLLYCCDCDPLPITLRLLRAASAAAIHRRHLRSAHSSVRATAARPFAPVARRTRAFVGYCCCAARCGPLLHRTAYIKLEHII